MRLGGAKKRRDANEAEIVKTARGMLTKRQRLALDRPAAYPIARSVVDALNIVGVR